MRSRITHRLRTDVSLSMTSVDAQYATRLWARLAARVDCRHEASRRHSYHDVAVRGGHGMSQ